MTAKDGVPGRWVVDHLRDRGRVTFTRADGHRVEVRVDLFPARPDMQPPMLPYLSLDNLAHLLNAVEPVERTYTLEEARPHVLRAFCQERGGHQIETRNDRSLGGTLTGQTVRCTRCGATFSEDPL